VRLDHRSHVHGDDRAVLHNDPAVDHRVARLLRSTKQRGGDRIVQAARIIHGVQVDGEIIRAFAFL
jgi:hypothetical protein